MRYLSKVVFINSARVRYDEVNLDGNVQFTGTQGVGKTTVLRAILFFYTADRNKLGLNAQGQRKFEDYYLPTSSSYVIYEVNRGETERPFCVIMFRSQNRPAYRFVDAPYSRDWFVGDNKVVASSQATIRNILQSRDIEFTCIIDRYTHYLDILYGAGGARVTKDQMKYYLLRSRQYENIPRIIQNVFLNSEVDSSAIKNTIIESLTDIDKDFFVDLEQLRRRLSNFTDELADIRKWTEKNKDGIVETLVKANQIISQKRDVIAREFHLREQCGMFNFARAKAASDIPVLLSKIRQFEEQENAIEKRILDLEAKYNEENKKKSDRIAILSENIKTASQLKRNYQQMGIEGIMAKVNNLPNLRLSLRQSEQLLSEMNAKYASITQKYDALRQRIELDAEQYVQKRKGERVAAKESLADRNAARLNQREKLRSEIVQEADKQITALDANISNMTGLLHEQELSRLAASKSSPMKKEISACNENIAKERKTLESLKQNLFEEQQRLTDIRSKFQLKCQQIESHAELQISKLEKDVENVKLKRDENRRMLDSIKGSLCEWLDKNAHGWEDNIGKIVDEHSVLYNQSLNPQMSDANSDTVFGIKLDLSDIEKEVRTPAKVREEISKYDEEITAISNAIIGYRDESFRQTAEVGKKFRSEEKATQNSIALIEQRIESCQQQIDNAALQLESILAQEQERLKERDTAFADEIGIMRVKLKRLKVDKQNILSNKQKELNSLDKRFRQDKKADEQAFEALAKTIGEDIADHGNKLAAKLLQLEQAANRELSTAGADTEMLDALKTEIAQIEAVITETEKKQETVFAYNKDRAEFIDRVPEFQVEKTRLEEEAASLRETFELRKTPIEQKRKECKSAKFAAIKSHEQAEKSVEAADTFMNNASCPPEMSEAIAVSTEQSCESIISAICDSLGRIKSGYNGLKEKINAFKAIFTAHNTFKFPTVLDTDLDYVNYADRLETFVKNDEIKESEIGTSAFYRDVLAQAATDFNNLLGRESEIKKIINEINSDFENKTFAGVIRRMELGLFQNTDPIITQLQNIAQFYFENQDSFVGHSSDGTLNLFSMDEDAESYASTAKDAIKYLKSLSAALNKTDIERLTLEQTVTLKFRIQENENETGWVENIKQVGSEGTDILVKALLNILLISVFKRRASKTGEARIHCMMDEIGRLADENIQGILNFANERDINLINASPHAHRPLLYRRIYAFTKDSNAYTHIVPILSTREVNQNETQPKAN